MKIREVMQQNDFQLGIGNFLDNFYRSSDKYNLIKDEVDFDQSKILEICLLAGTAHKLANDYGLEVPKWCLKYKLKNEYYGNDTKNTDFQRYLEETTPVEFASRNLFVGSNVLSRV